MEVTTACRLIDQLVLMPGWTIESEDYTRRHEGTVRIKVVCQTYQSEREDSFNGYPNAVGARAEFAIIVTDVLDDIELYRRVMRSLLDFFEHEMREFFRIQPSMWAPFHPHRVQGMRNWNDSDAQIVHDLHYGIV